MAGILLQGNGVTDEQRAAHAREVAASGQEMAKVRREFTHALLGDTRLLRATRISGDTLEDRTIAAGSYWSGHVMANQHLRIIDLEGRQAVDFLCYDAKDVSNRYNAANTIKVNRSIYLGCGTSFYSERGDRLVTIAEDTVGFHDTIGGCCSEEMNYLRYGIRHTRSCRDNFVEALAPHGMSGRDIVANVNFFMYVPVRPDGSTELIEGASNPGDFVDLCANRDVLCFISNCPQIYNPCNGWTPSPIRVIKWQEFGQRVPAPNAASQS